MIENNFLNKFCTDRNIKNNTRKGYDSAIRKYIEFHDEKLDLLIFEAQNDKKKNILLKNRNIKNRLLSFRNYLFTTELSNNTIKTYLSRIKLSINIMKLKFQNCHQQNIMWNMKQVI